MSRSLNLIVAACSLSFASCNQAALMKRFTPPADEAIAREYFEQLRQGKFDQIEHDLEPSLVDASVPNTLAQMAAMLPAGSPRSTKVVGAHVFSGSGVSRTNITLECEFPSKWVLVDVTTQRKDGALTLVGFHVKPISDSLENLNKFTLIGKGGRQYFVLVLAVFATLFSLYALVSCLRAKNVKRKWLWAILILVGFGKLAVNWTTGEWGFQSLSFQVPCGTASAQLYGPWIVAVSFPLGALVFLLWRRESPSPTELGQPSAPVPAAGVPPSSNV